MSEQQVQTRPARKTRTGKVVSAKMQKSVVVELRRRIAHHLYTKQATRTKRVIAHDENNDARIGDVVRLMETRPLSKTKRWRVVAVIQRAE